MLTANPTVWDLRGDVGRGGALFQSVVDVVDTLKAAGNSGLFLCAGLRTDLAGKRKRQVEICSFNIAFTY